MHPLRTGLVLPTHPLRKALGIIGGAFLTIVAHTNGSVISVASPSLADVTSAISSASDGDTVVVPAGSADWTSVLTITKGITLIGATTITNAGTQNPTVSDLTIIRDDSPLNTNQSGLIQTNLIPSQSFRLTGFTFTHGVRTTENNIGLVHLLSNTSSSPLLNMRVDHCHFDRIYGRNIQTDGWVYGVADHNYIVARGVSQSIYVNNATYGGYLLGHGAWADFPWFGTNKFFFIEDNTIVGSGNISTSGAIDAEYGGRWVARHNYFNNAHTGWHGTEGANRGCRSVEIYDNTYNWTIAPSQSNRSGVSLQHDNTWIGTSSTDNAVSSIVLFRENSGVTATTAYGVGDGTSIYDINDTEGNGTYVEGHSPFLFDSGTTTAASVLSGTQATLVDSTKSWTANQWVGYSIKEKNPLAPAYNKGSYVISNTPTVITYYVYLSGDRGPTLLFGSGDAYEIHRILKAIDQTGLGKGDLLSGSNPAINTVTGVPGQPHQAIEPAFCWHNIYTPTSTDWTFHSAMPTEISGRDYYNLSVGTADTTPSQVSSTYVAALNGVAYTGTYIYPHPLVSGRPPAPTNLRVQ